MEKARTKAFFGRPTLAVAKELLGKFLVRRGKELTCLITEVEAYDGPNDLASHASRGMTPRTKVMFGEAGRFYVYFTYGMHWLINVVTGPQGYPAAVLLRAGILCKDDGLRLLNGPARLTRAMHIDGNFNEVAANRTSGLWFEDCGARVGRSGIVTSRRIGVEYAGDWRDKPYNLRIAPERLARVCLRAKASRNHPPF